LTGSGLPPFLLGALMAIFAAYGPARADLSAAAQDKKPAAQPARTASRTPAARPKYRKLAPGAMRTVDPRTQLDEGYDRHDVIEVLSADPKYAERDWSQGKSPARDTVFRRDIWSLEFSFKPVRFVQADVPTPDGRMQNKLIWYLVYSVKNSTDKPVTFVPWFVLVGKDTGKVYPSRVIPLATPLIRKREDPQRPLLNTSEMTGKIAPTPPGQEATIWGVATWEDIDPATDTFAIYVQGLTNAYRWENPVGALAKGALPGSGRKFFPKTLILNFWRPGDKELEHEKEIRFEDYAWAYGELTDKGFIAKKRDPEPRVAVPAEGDAPAVPGEAVEPDAAALDEALPEGEAASDNET